MCVHVCMRACRGTPGVILTGEPCWERIHAKWCSWEGGLGATRLPDLSGDPRNPGSAKTQFSNTADTEEPGYQTLSHSCWGLRTRSSRMMRPWGSGDQPQGGLLRLLWQLECEHVKYMIATALWGPEVTAEPFPTGAAEGTLLVLGMFACDANARASVACSLLLPP